MGLAEYFLGSGNPFAQWANTNRRTLGGIGAGLASGTNFGEGLALAARGAAAGREADDAYATQQKAEAQRVAEINQTAEWLKNNYPQFADLPPAQGFQLAAQLAGQKQGGSEYSERYAAGQQFGLQGEDLNTFALTGSVPGTARTNVTYGTTPVWGKDSTTGKTGYGVTVFGAGGIVTPEVKTGYGLMLKEIVKFFQTRVPPVPAEDTIELIAFMEAADESKRQGGKPVTLESVMEKALQK